MSEKSEVLIAAQEHAFDLFKQKEDKHLVYHNYNHTVDVVNAAEEIAKGSDLPETAIELLLIAAWFHDTGYTAQYEDHEEKSAEFAAEFMRHRNYDDTKVSTVTSAIMATRLPQSPTNLLEDILCDADFAHLASKKLVESSQLLRLEWELVGKTPADMEWPEADIKFLTEHNYKSEYAQRKFAKGKTKNLLRLQELQKDKAAREAKERDRKQKEEERKEKERSKQVTPDRGIETMFRVSFRNHMDLSSIADNKANIMLSINAIILSIALSSLIPEFADNPGLVLPTLGLLLVCIVTIVFATLSTRPKISEGKFTREDIRQRKPNLLFFGNFHGMPLEEFDWGMREMMKSKDYLYGTMIKDFYSLGTVLARKYRYLRICYLVFMYGMIAVVAGFIVSFILA